jgi:hypothetical protein
MKKQTNFFYRIYLFFFYLTSKGKDAKMYKDAEANLHQYFLEEGASDLKKQISKNKTKNKCIDFATRVTKKKKLSNFHLGKITSEKHKEELKENALKIHPKTLEFKNA